MMFRKYYTHSEEETKFMRKIKVIPFRDSRVVGYVRQGERTLLRSDAMMVYRQLMYKRNIEARSRNHCCN